MAQLLLIFIQLLPSLSLSLSLVNGPIIHWLDNAVGSAHPVASGQIRANLIASMGGQSGESQNGLSSEDIEWSAQVFGWKGNGAHFSVILDDLLQKC